GEFRNLPGFWGHLPDRISGDSQHLRGHGSAPHQGTDVTLHLVRRDLSDRDDGGSGDPLVAQRSLGKQGGRTRVQPEQKRAGCDREPRGIAAMHRWRGARVRVMIAGGGTGGHLFPGIALAQELVTRHPKNDVVFVGTNRGLERRIVPAAGYKLEIIGARGLKGVGPVRLLGALWALPLSFFKSWSLLRRYQPDVVVG